MSQAQAQAVAIEPIDDQICGLFNALSEQDKQRFRAIINNPRYQNTNGQFDFFSVFRRLFFEALHFNETHGANETMEKLRNSVLSSSKERHTTTLRKYDENYVIFDDNNFILNHFENFRTMEPHLFSNYDDGNPTERVCSTIQNICMNTLTDTVVDSVNVVIPTATAVGGRRKSRRTKKRKTKRRKSKRTRK